MIVTHGLQIDWSESGSGPAVLFLPGSFSTPAAWRAMHRLLPPHYRLVATSLCGYGGTTDTRRAGDADMRHELRVVEALARRIDAPVHLVGHSFGGTVALAAALAGTMEVTSLSLFEANPLRLLPGHGRQDLHDHALQMSRNFEAALADGERDAAARVIDYWGGPGCFAAMPPGVQDYCRATAPANVLDWHTDFGYELRTSDLARLRMPVLLTRGEHANPAMVAITDALAQALPQARMEVVAGANHFLISSHAAACAALLTAFLEGTQDASR